MAMPELRFTKVDGTEYPAWELERIGDIIESYEEKVDTDSDLPILTSSKNYGIQFQNEHFGREQTHDIDGYNVLPRGYCTYRNRSDGVDFTFNINNICDVGIVSKFYPVFKDAGCDLYFLTSFLNNSSKARRVIAYTAVGTGQRVLSFSDLKSITLVFPCLEEQQKIADFLSDLDAVISTSEAEVAALEQQKKGAMQKIFSQEVRFRRDDGTEYPAWEEKLLGDVFEISSERNGTRYSKNDVLSVSDEYGLVNQIAFQGRSFAGEDISKYKVVRNGQIVYTRSPLAAKPYGIIKLVRDIEGIVSPLYVVNNVSDGQCPLFWYYNFDSPKRTNKYLAPLVRLGPKHTMNISNDEWLSGIVFAPCLEEQQKIADFLSSFDAAIDLARQELEKWKLLKKGLMQQMFV